MVWSVTRLIGGFRTFRARHYEHSPEKMRDLVEKGQSPRVMVVACSDSRVDPALLLETEPGELFVVRNVANIVPPYESFNGVHSTQAALEYAVRDLEVRHVIVLGHSACGGIAALRAARKEENFEREFMARWMHIAEDACLCGQDGEIPDQTTVEQANVRLSLRNLRTYPWVVERNDAGTLDLQGWWVDLERGRLCALDPDTDDVRELVGGTPDQGVAD